MIQLLSEAHVGTDERKLFEEYQTEKRISDASSSFVRVDGADGGRFPLTGTGDVNTYPLFTELFVNLKNRLGRAGVIVPVGIATNETTSPFFASLIERNLLASLFAFSEIKAWFSGTKDNQSFCLLTFGACKEAEFSFQIRDWSDLADPRRRFKLQTETVRAMNPNTSTAPVFRSRADAEITTKIYEIAPVLINDNQGTHGDPWGMSFARLFDMANDSNLFKTSKELSELGLTQKGNEWFATASDALPHSEGASDKTVLHAPDFLPLFEAKMVNFYDHRWGYYPDGATDDTRALPRPTLQDKCNVMFEVNPRYWVKREDVEARLSRKNWNRNWLIGWRDVTNITNERTLIAGCVPLVGTGDKFLLALPDQQASLCACLLANFSALSTDFAARQKLGGRVSDLLCMSDPVHASPKGSMHDDLQRTSR